MRLMKSMAATVSISAILFGSTIASAQSWNFDTLMDRVAQEDSRNWIYKDSYDSGSMHDSQLVAQSSDGRRILLKGYYTYDNGTSSYMLVRITDNQVSCISYDTSWTNCTLNGSEPGTGTMIAGTLALALVAVAASGGSSSSDGGRSGSGSSGDDDGYRRPSSPPPPPPPAPAARTYGLYGDCPQPGAGYGC